MSVILKRLKSYFISDWTLDDYPIKLYQNENAGSKDIAFGARILNWTFMVEFGESKEIAYENLQKKFNEFKKEDVLPRPGKVVPLQFAPTTNIDKYEEIAVDFFEKILDMNYYEGFQSDGSYIELLFLEFSKTRLEEIKSNIVQKTKEIYDVDISDVYDDPLWIVFKKIHESKNAATYNNA